MAGRCLNELQMNRDELTQAILAECEAWIGTPYCHQASCKGAGCDCLGLLRGIWRHLYGSEPETMPAYTGDWGEASAGEPLLDAAFRHLAPVEEIEPGNVVLFRWEPHLPAKHVAIMVSNTTFIHACEHAGVTRARLGSHWRGKIAGIFRFPMPAETTQKTDR